MAHLQQTHQQPAVAASASSNAAEDVAALRQRESQLQAQLMDKILENMELRRHLQSAKAAAEPAVVQVFHGYRPFTGRPCCKSTFACAIAAVSEHLDARHANFQCCPACRFIVWLTCGACCSLCAVRTLRLHRRQHSIPVIAAEARLITLHLLMPHTSAVHAGHCMINSFHGSTSCFVF